MSGAGSATVAYALEQSYNGALVDSDTDGTPEWYQPGIDVTVGDLTVEQALERRRQPDDPTPAGSREGNWEGALSVSYTLTDDNWHDLVFADGGTALPHSPMAAPSATWYFEVELPDGSTEPRTPTGAVVQEATINYEQGSDVTVELTILFGDEPNDVTAPADADIQQPAESDAFSRHGTTFDVDGMSQTALLQSATLSLSGLARFRRGADRKPHDAVTGPIEPSLSSDAIFTERDQLAMAVDNADDAVGKVPATLEFSNGQGTTIGYNLTGVQPASYGWSNLIAPDSDLAEPIDYHVADVEVA